MKTWKWGVLVTLCSTGCVSISTHEKIRKEWEASRAAIENLQSQLLEQEEKNQNLKETEKDLQEKISNIRSSYDELVENLKDDIRSGQVGVEGGEGTLKITMGDAVLFESGRADLQVQGQKILLTVAKTLAKINDKDIQVEGHTDNVRIAGPLKKRYPTNWELSADRATSVVRFLQEKGHINPAKLILSAFSEYHPTAENTSPKGRERNRRVEISLVPQRP